MHNTELEWAGVRFVALHHHDGQFFRGPGLFAFVRRHPCGERSLLFVEHADNIACAVTGHRLWADALRLGFNELNVNLQALERVDRLILRERIVRRCGPVLNVLEDDRRDPPRAETPQPLSIWSARKRA